MISWSDYKFEYDRKQVAPLRQSGRLTTSPPRRRRRPLPGIGARPHQPAGQERRPQEQAGRRGVLA